MPRLKQEYSEADGWTRWVQPKMDGYKMGCCDCGLVHKMQFRVLKLKDANTGVLMPQHMVKVQFRVQRDKRSTAAVRRKKANG